MISGPSALKPSAFVFVDDLHDPAPGPADQHHLARVLRLRAGEPVVVADGEGSWRPCAVVSISGAGLVLESVGEVVSEPAPSPPITIGFALTKGDKPEWVVQKLTELGVDHIVPVTAERSIVRWDPGRAARHHERLVVVAREACMQSRRSRLPTVSPPLSLDDAISSCGPFALCEAGGDAVLDLSRPALFVGPEGGWSPTELALAPDVVDLGPATLRAETAAFAAGVLLSALRNATVRGKEA